MSVENEPISVELQVCEPLEVAQTNGSKHGSRVTESDAIAAISLDVESDSPWSCLENCL